MLNYMDILPVIRGTMSYVCVKHCIEIMSSAAGLAVGLARQRAGVTSEYTGGTVVSEARDCPLGKVLSFAPSCWLHNVHESV